MHGVGVGGRVHGDGGDAELLARALDAQRDLSSVGDQDLVEHSLRAVGSKGSRQWGISAIQLSLCLLPIADCLFSLFDDDERLAEFDRLAILDEDRGDRARVRSRNLVHGLHGFDDQQRLALATRVPISMNGGAPGSGER